MNNTTVIPGDSATDVLLNTQELSDTLRKAEEKLKRMEEKAALRLKWDGIIQGLEEDVDCEIKVRFKRVHHMRSIYWRYTIVLMVGVHEVLEWEASTPREALKNYETAKQMIIMLKEVDCVEFSDVVGNF